MAKKLSDETEKYSSLNLPVEFGYEHSKYCSYEFSDIKVKDDTATAKVNFSRPDISQVTTVDDLPDCEIITEKLNIKLVKNNDQWRITNIY